MVGADDPEYQGDDQQARVRRAVRLRQRARGRAARSDPRDDIITKLLDAEIEGEQLSELEFDMFFLLLAVAGNETTRNATAHGMHALLTNPDQFEKLKATPMPASARGRGDPAVGVAGAALPPHRASHDYRDPRPSRSRRATRSSSGTSRPTATRRCSTTRSFRHRARPEPPRRVRRRRRRTSASAPTSPARSSG